MREIKFRGKRADGKWAVGSLVRGSNDKKVYIFTLDEIEQWTVDPETVGQYTGLKDKNGKDAYDGDVIYTGGKPQAIKWSDTISGWAMWQGVGATTGIPEKFEIIGNIYEHPHLLEGRDEA